MTTQTVTQEWIEEVLEQHRYLRSVVAALREYLNEPRPAAGEKGSHSWAAELSKQLMTLHDELYRHFRFEEEGDVMDELIEAHPEAAGQLEAVLGEHPAMLSGLRGIVSDVLSYSEGGRPEDPRLRQRITDLLDELRDHEQEENHLFQRLEYRDVGAAD